MADHAIQRALLAGAVLACESPTAEIRTLRQFGTKSEESSLRAIVRDTSIRSGEAPNVAGVSLAGPIKFEEERGKLSVYPKRIAGRVGVASLSLGGRMCAFGGGRLLFAKLDNSRTGGCRHAKVA